MGDGGTDGGVRRGAVRAGGVRRRTALLAVAGSFVTGAAVWGVDGEPLWDRVKPKPSPVIPDVPEGQVRWEKVRSTYRGTEVGLFTAVPDGHGAGEGLPVCMVLHGSTGTTADFRGYGLGRFLTAAVRAGAPPFVLAGVDGGVIRWARDGADDPQGMLVHELPDWLSQRSFGAVRAGWGWSMGGFGVLSYAVANPGKLAAVAAFSPAVYPGDALMQGPPALARTPLGIWCGTEDALYPNVRQLVDHLPSQARIVDYSPGAHTRAFWNDHTVEAFRFLGTAIDTRSRART